jgi:hypothetical protein
VHRVLAAQADVEVEDELVDIADPIDPPTELTDSAPTEPAPETPPD